LKHKLITAVLASTVVGLFVPATSSAQQRDTTITAEVRTQVIDTVLKRLKDYYVFPQTAAAMEQNIRERIKQGEYADVTSGRRLGEILTEHLQAISSDKHLRVRYAPAPARPERAQTSPAERSASRQRELERMNYGFDKVERLAGNIGYIELRGFTDAERGAETVAAAMTLVANTDALIIDLRRNGGGSPEMVALISSYLFADPVHLNSLYWRAGDRTEDFWTRKEVKGKRYLGKDVYILTSKRTFSAAEEFSYNLQNLKRATIVGETTGGGAHPGEMMRFLREFEMFVPTGRAINPITKTNWEGVGVKPEVQAPADQALLIARLMAMKKIVANTSEPPLKAAMQAEMDRLEKELEGLKQKTP
jgi:C-terminal processing protease CtpA/Prc